MALEILLKRGTTAANDAFIGKAGSLSIDTELQQLRIHDGITPGGHVVPNALGLSQLQTFVENLGIEHVAGLQAALDGLSADITALESSVQDIVNTALTAIDGRVTTLEGDVAALEVGKIDVTEKGAANGVASLNELGKIPTDQIPDSVLGQVEYMGTWDAATNTPTLPELPESKGEYYVATTAGTFAGLDFEIGDWIISDGTKWDRVKNTDAVRSVAGRTGDVVLTKEDVGLDQVDNTSDLAKPVSTAQQAALDLKADKTYVDEQIGGLNTGVSSVTGTGAVQVDNNNPANPVISVDDATGLTSGLMSAADKAKLDTVAEGAQVNTVNSVQGRTGDVVITKEDLGLENVQNYAIATQEEAEAGTATDKLVTPLGVRQFIEAMGFVQDENGDWSVDQGQL